MSLTGKTSIITGGSDGIGRAIAAKLRARARMLLFAPEMQKNWSLLPRILEPLVDQLKRGFKMLPIRIASLP